LPAIGGANDAIGLAAASGARRTNPASGRQRNDRADAGHIDIHIHFRKSEVTVARGVALGNGGIAPRCYRATLPPAIVHLGSPTLLSKGEP